MSQGMQADARSWKSKETFSLEPPKGSADTLTLVQGGPLWTSDYCKIINLCCFTPLSVW